VRAALAGWRRSAARRRPLRLSGHAIGAWQWHAPDRPRLRSLPGRPQRRAGAASAACPLARAWEESLAFLDFPAIADPAAFKADFRDALDRAGRTLGETDDVVADAAAAFRLNIAVAEAVQSATERVAERA
jgi:hypothetical protein